MTRPVLAALLALGLVACRDPSPGTRLEITVSPTPASVGAAQVRVSLADTTAGAPRAPLLVTGRRDDGGGRAVIDTAGLIRPGLWVADSFAFDAAGSWTLEARATLPDGRVVEGRHRIRVLGR